MKRLLNLKKEKNPCFLRWVVGNLLILLNQLVRDLVSRVRNFYIMGMENYIRAENQLILGDLFPLLLPEAFDLFCRAE